MRELPVRTIAKCGDKCPYYKCRDIFVGSHYVDFPYCTHSGTWIEDTEEDGFPYFCPLKEVTK